jgi:phosphohistidine swiveling domain-containing protein
MSDLEPTVVGVGPDFPVEFSEPFHARITWEWDDMHMPFALTPLAGDWAEMIGNSFDSWKFEFGGDYPSRSYARVWNGYAYYGFSPNATPAEREANRARALELWRTRIDVTEAYWTEVVAELRAIYETMRRAPIEAGAPAAAAEAWERAWAGATRAWWLHFIVIIGPYQVLEDLADLYESFTPNAPPGEAMRLMQGGRHELLETELGIERLAEIAATVPAVATAMRGGERSAEHLATLPGGEAFTAELRAFLDEHGHMGQSIDDLALASWGEEPSLLLAEIAKRLDRPADSAEARRQRLAREADELADAARARLADRPDDLARFERVLAQSRRIGPLTEVHNYWIDRASQATVRRLAMRVGARLVREGAIARPDDVLFLDHDEIGPLLLEPEDRRSLIEERRGRFERQRTSTPPKYVGKAPDTSAPVDRFDSAKVESTETGVLRGTGASAGIVRGPARVVLTSHEFERIVAGDVIVCPSSNPSWVPVFTIAGGLVTNTGGVLSHAAVVAREFGLPAVVGVAGATTSIRDGQQVEIDGTAGTVRLL